MPDIVILDFHALNPGDLCSDALKKCGTVTAYDRTPPELVPERVGNASIVLTNKTVLDAATLRALPQLRYIGILATGCNVVDLAAATELGITVTNVPGYGTDSVAQAVFAFLLTFANHLEHYAAETASGHWSRSKDFCYWNTPLTELAGKTMGIVGCGAIGGKVAKIALAFGMKVLVSSRRTILLPEIIQVDQERLFRESDIVSLHCSLTEETKEMIHRDVLLKMKPTAWLINTGRGGLIREQDLADALNNHVIAAAGLDVLSEEPPPPDNPLLRARNCFITPHLAWATPEARQRLLDIATGNIEAFLEGKIWNRVNSN